MAMVNPGGPKGGPGGGGLQDEVEDAERDEPVESEDEAE